MVELGSPWSRRTLNFLVIYRDKKITLAYYYAQNYDSSEERKRKMRALMS